MHSYSNYVYLHDYCSNCAFMHNFTPTDVGVFLVSAYLNTFFYFALTDASALSWEKSFFNEQF